MGRRAGITSIVFCFVILAIAAYLVYVYPTAVGDSLFGNSVSASAPPVTEDQDSSDLAAFTEQSALDGSSDKAAESQYERPENDDSLKILPETESTEDELSQSENREPLTAIPVRICIEKLDIDAEIQATGRDGNSMAIVPSSSIISWYKLSSIPGNEGNCLLAGHRLWKGQNSHLAQLDLLDIGDEMIISYSDGSIMSFLLESVFVYELATAPADKIMDLHGEARVTVITCKAPFNPKTGTSDFRIVATFKEESKFIIPDPPIEPFPSI